MDKRAERVQHGEINEFYCRCRTCAIILPSIEKGEHCSLNRRESRSNIRLYNRARVLVIGGIALNRGPPE